MKPETGRERVRAAIQQQLASYAWNPAELARRAGVDPGTVADFLNGERWPQSATRAKISNALSWGYDGIERMLQGLDPETVASDAKDDGVLASLPPEALEGLGAAEREEVIAAAKLSALQKAREIRRRLDE